MDKELSILCFGASLTAGYYHFGCEYHPYALRLKEKLQAAFPTTKFTVDEDGLPGDLVIKPGRFLPRIKEKFDGSNYDWVIVLGGTKYVASSIRLEGLDAHVSSDLGRGYPASKIYPALQEVWEVALDNGAFVLALTIPECSAASTTLDQRRNEVNLSILSHKAQGFYAFDLHGKVPYHNATEEFRKRIWDDGLHFTAEGYDLVGEVVGEHLIALLKDQGL
ncbi:hypothetical protein KXW98_000118 [Aspergillus fumigatus]|nr:hypothetical protein KXX30_002810 [Aspergillus fumigatus]KAH1342861.1 hypothetical protein KXX67_006069 [Aspergillus fumigatus]KAH1367181.1 hypothetical protein KXX33_007696 [Aspergillus fumigatus]KAH1401687.1 hypothetical protein KXX22_003198 [Aspergillus fumigatus]KAH1455198.1 hypothetical protein KXX13_001029 [Aspergillus fumigatus]